MASAAEIKLSMKKWLNEELGLPFIFEEQADPRPSVRPYGTIRILNQAHVGGNDVRGAIDDHGVRTLKGVRSGAVSVNIFGDGAIESMQLARDSMFKETSIMKMWDDYGLSITTAGDIQNLTGLLETDFEERAQMDVNILYAREYDEDVGLIKHVNIEGEADGTTITQETIDLP